MNIKISWDGTDQEGITYHLYLQQMRHISILSFRVVNRNCSAAYNRNMYDMKIKDKCIEALG